MAAPLIEFRDVTKRFGDKTVLNKVNLKIYENQITTIIGKSGTGKTVLLKHIIGLLKPDEGSILFKGKPVEEMKKNEWNEYKRQISYLFQNNALFDSMTVGENVALPLIQTTSLSAREIEEKVMMRLTQTELADARDRYPAELSGGMQKRAALARALVTDPNIVLFDEPTTGQDPIRKNSILSMIAQYRKRFGFTAVVISHDIPDVFFVSDRIVLLWEGSVGVEGTYEEAIQLGHPMIREFLLSLEGLQNELTGLLSKEAFRSCYASMFAEGPLEPITSAVLLTLDLDDLAEVLGPQAPVEVMEALGDFTGRHFRPLGGFSVRYSKARILTILPHTSPDEADQLMAGYSRKLEEQALAKIESISGPKLGPGRCYEINIHGGVAEVSPRDDIEQIVGKAALAERVVATYRCDRDGATP